MVTSTSKSSTSAASIVDQPEKTSRWPVRLGAIAAGLVLNLVYVLIVTKAADYDLKTPGVFGQDAAPIQIPIVIVASVVPALVGWGLLALLERITRRRAALIWGIIAVLVLVGGLPYNGAGITGSDQVLLGVMHVIVGIALIPAFVISSVRNR